MIFRNTPMQEILSTLHEALAKQTSISFEVLDPDEGAGYTGNRRRIGSEVYRYRGYKAWTDLAELLGCQMMTPRPSDYPLVRLTFRRLAEDSFHQEQSPIHEERYGTASAFFEIEKMEEPAFFYYYDQALTQVNLSQRHRILNLGINRGDEFEVLEKRLSPEAYRTLELVGVDHSQSAIAYAKRRFPTTNVQLYAEDINQLASLELGRFDLLISIGTLQSRSIHFKPFLMSLVQEYLTEDSALILGFPNSRWIGGEMIYGAKAPNYAMSEMSLLYNDVMFAKKYLQQHKYRVMLTGKQYIFLSAVKIGQSSKK